MTKKSQHVVWQDRGLKYDEIGEVKWKMTYSDNITPKKVILTMKTCGYFLSGPLTGQLFSKLPLSSRNVSFHAVRICRNKVCDQPGTILLSNLSLFLVYTMPVLSGNSYSLMEKLFHYAKPSA